MGFIEQRFGPGSGTWAYRWVGLFAAVFSILVMFGFVNVSDRTSTNSTINSSATPNNTLLPSNNNRGNGIAP